MSDQNKRKYPRVEGKGIGAYLRLNGHNAGCTVQNISVGGIFVKTDRFLPVGTKLAFDLVKPGMKKALTVSGWVVGVITAELSARTKLPQGLRIQFGKLTPSASEALQEMVGSLRRSDAAPPVLYPVEPKAKKGGSGLNKPPRASGLTSLPVRKPSRILGEEPANSTEVDRPAQPGPRDQGAEDPSLVRQWFKEGEGPGGKPGGGSGEQPMIDDGLLDSAGEPDLPPEPEPEPPSDPEAAAAEEQEEEAPPPAEDGLEPGIGEEFDLPPEMTTEPPGGPNPFDDEERTIGVDPAHAGGRFGESESSKRPTALRPPPPRVRAEVEEAGEEAEEEHTPGDAAPEGGEGALDELESANRELQRLLDRREGEIATLRTQVKTLETALKDREEQLQLAKRVLKTHGLG